MLPRSKDGHPDGSTLPGPRHRWLARGAFAVATILTIAAGLLASHRLNEARRAWEWVEHTALVLDAIHEVRVEIAGVAAAKHSILHGAAVTVDSQHKARAMAALGRGRSLTRDNPQQQQIMDTLDDLLQEELSELSATVDLARRGKLDSARIIARDEETEHRADRIDVQLLHLSKNEHALMLIRTESHGRHAGLGRLYVAMAVVASVLLGLVGTLLIRHGEQRARGYADAAQSAAAEARRSEGRFRAALDAMLDPFFIARPVNEAPESGELEILEANEAGADLAGMSRDRLLGARLGAVLPSERAAAVTRICRDVIASVTRYTANYRLGMPGGGDRWLRLQVVPAAEGVAIACQDITTSKRAEAALAALAVRDELTGLLNRRGFRDQAEQRMRLARRVNRADALLALDLNGFKGINDTYGHAEGDAALREVSRVLQATLREVDVIARLGGDEFVVYAPGAEGDDKARLLAARLADAFVADNATALAGGRQYALEAGIGVAVLEAGDTLDTLLARADADLYAQKTARSAPPR
jgi:diguanylate cyclase (GGDEF)-like protein/PAS domain S-box-containing protein